jgi:hypothetical protein
VHQLGQIEDIATLFTGTFKRVNNYRFLLL